MKKNKNSIIHELFFYSIRYYIILTIILSLFFAVVIFNLEKRKAEGFLKRTNYAINIFIEGYFKDIVDFVEILSKNQDIINAPYRSKETRKKILKIYKTYQDINNDINYIYSGYKNKELIINDYTPPENYDPTVRPWYRSVMDNPQKDKKISGLLYREAKSREWLISTIKILKSSEYGYTGVVAIDSFSTSIAKKVNEKSKEYDTAYSYILDKSGKVVIHQKASLIGASFFKKVKIYNKSLKEGLFFYSYKNKYKMAYMSRIKTTGWSLVTTMNLTDILGSICIKIFYCVLFLSAFAVVAGILQSRSFMARFIAPFIALKERMEAVILFGKIKDSHVFPDNEIGYISEQIGKITEQALYKKTVELQAANDKINEINTDLEKKNKMLHKLATHDSLTGLYNRQKIESVFESSYYRFLRYKIPLSGILIDIDFFKYINDTFGHNTGDEVLKKISRLSEKNIREADVIGRWGGEEFLVILTDTKLEGAVNVAEKLKDLIMEYDFGIKYKVTASFGVVEIKDGESEIDAFIRMDKKLYEAKDNGRNQVRF